MSLKVGFIGLGAMGTPMARNLANAGLDLVVFDVRSEAVAVFTRTCNARGASSAAEAANGRDIVITIVPTSDIVENVVFGAHGIVHAEVKPKLWVEMTSGLPQKTQDIASRLSEIGISSIDAPVSGGVIRAEAGSLSIMVGGPEALLTYAQPVLERLGTSITHVGPLGAGQALKALNNMASAAGLLIACEVLWVAKKFGLDCERVVDVINDSSGMNNSTKTKVKQFILSGSYASGFGFDLMVKDLGIATALADSLEADVPFAKACLDLWRQYAADIGPGHDHTEIAKVVATRVGI